MDPFDQYDDAALNDALRAAGLSELQSEMEDNKITLDTQVSSGGGNLSVGQRQILALARAIVRGSKLLILDEGTYLCNCFVGVRLSQICTSIILQPLLRLVSFATVYGFLLANL